MVTSRLEDGIVWFIIEGDLTADEMIPETDKWLSRLDEYCGYITDIRKMEKASSYDKQRMEDQRKKNKTGKPSALLLKDDAMSVIAKIYINFTKAKDTRYFTDPEKAKEWLKNFKSQ
ncbi:hypothetical protein HQ585_14465 [candidate division KSB1 bacterium]|nr:hypothetical protein [candidate division KSB1 bacterium]